MLGDKTSDTLDSAIRHVLFSSKKPLSTYEIAKKTGISWSTANMHCFKLKSQGVFNNKRESSVGRRKKVVWWICE
ncbi:MAG: winged helix-turn-helix domain-containing protein [Nanoarchaeota archaeon]|nr:winged helix-turn-helix domain-containing protein [Nanoarchaeota archaeon]MBU4300162.1 winged helix-turn-helix domain-containing protein [Nanoarchaeota archaeon]MBU4452198.1 winged helix-turn-helix domain-containing protein [Nanoarchaeota archaeon]MCG2724368.1 winged helix-turn-helix domain-containing protein [archaeon]